MKIQIDTGARFGRLTVLSRAETAESGHRQWACVCDCGVRRVVGGSLLIRGGVRSCGCLRSEWMPKLHALRTSHGKSQTKVYRAWSAMRTRCYNANGPMYQHYGGRGIRVCEAWRASFEAFLVDMGEPLPGQSLDRIDNDGNYEPGNCRWANPDEQANNKRSNVNIEFNGVVRTKSEWANALGLTWLCLDRRIDRWGVARALTSKPRAPKGHAA